jgi:phosphoacetylglucosamine mutase
MESDDIYINLNGIDSYDKGLKVIEKIFSYGTSGFRTNDEEIERLTFRAAIVTCILSKFHGIPVGITITASHNKYTDNGLKIASYNGESLEATWEKYYENIVNSKCLVDDLKAFILQLQEMTSIKNFHKDNTAVVVFAYDTRRSSLKLSEIVR